MAAATQQTCIDGVTIDGLRRGAGRTLLFLHPDRGLEPSLPVYDLLAEHFQLIAPSHPGFDHSDMPKEFRSVDDLAYFYLSLGEQLDLTDAILVGCGFGGWIAAEMAVRSHQRYSHLVLAAPLGIKVNGRESRDIADVHAMSSEAVQRAAFHDPTIGLRDYRAMSEAERLGVARSREAFTHFGWTPYMHNPSLRRWLRRITLPTLVLAGAADNITRPDYARAFAAEIPGAEFALMEQAGHYPHIERPEAFVQRICEFAAPAASGA